MTNNIVLKTNNKPIKEGFYLVQRKNRFYFARIIDNKHYGESLFLVLGDIGQFPLEQLEEDCLWSDEITIEDDIY